MKLYCVILERQMDILCLAESREEAIQQTRNKWLDDEIRENDDPADWDIREVEEIRKEKKIPPRWRGSLVYCEGKSQITPEQFLAEAGPPPSAPAAGQTAFLEEEA